LVSILCGYNQKVNKNNMPLDHTLQSQYSDGQIPAHGLQVATSTMVKTKI